MRFELYRPSFQSYFSGKKDSMKKVNKIVLKKIYPTFLPSIFAISVFIFVKSFNSFIKDKS